MRIIKCHANEHQDDAEVGHSRGHNHPAELPHITHTDNRESKGAHMYTVQQSRLHLGMFVIVAYALAWVTWSFGFVQNDVVHLNDTAFAPYLLAGSFAPTIAALIITAMYGGVTAIRDLFHRLLRIRMHWSLYLFIFAAFPAISIAVYVIIGIPNSIPLWQIAVTLLPVAPLNALMGGIIFGYGPLGEEMGWRGFMQERLGQRHQHIWSALIIGVVWALWHAPLFRFDDFRLGLDLGTFFPLYTLSLVFTSFTMAHLWRWSGGSLFAAIFFHAIINTTTSTLTDSTWWNLGTRTNLELYIIILSIFALTALLAEILHRTYGRLSHE